MTRQVEYQGEVVALTESLVGFPAGGQVLLSGVTYQRVYGNLHTVQFDDRVAGPNSGKETTANKEDFGECAMPQLFNDHVTELNPGKEELTANRILVSVQSPSC